MFGSASLKNDFLTTQAEKLKTTCPLHCPPTIAIYVLNVIFKKLVPQTKLSPVFSFILFERFTNTHNFPVGKECMS